MGIERTLKVGKTYIDVFLDNNLHILDKDMPGTMSVTNAMSDYYLQEVMGWIGDYRYNRVFQYHTDGVVTEWVNNKYFIIDYSEPGLYRWFVKLIRDREVTFVH